MASLGKSAHEEGGGGAAPSQREENQGQNVLASLNMSLCPSLYGPSHVVCRPDGGGQTGC